jgi:DNA-binding transcriptional LysR family regulator
MKLLARVIVGSIIAAVAAGAAVAQVPPGLPNPDLQNRIPAPLPPPPQPPIINGPLSQSPPAGTYLPPRLNTHSDRTTTCLQEGSGYGLRGRKLDAYARACANQ